MRTSCGIRPYEDALTELTVRSLIQALCYTQVKPRNCQVELEFRLGCYTPTAHIGSGSFLPVTFDTPAVLNPHAKRAYRFRSGVDGVMASHIEEALLRSKLARPHELQTVRESVIVRTRSGHRHHFRCEDMSHTAQANIRMCGSGVPAASHASAHRRVDKHPIQRASLRTSMSKITSRAEEVCCPSWNSDVRLALAFEQELPRVHGRHAPTHHTHAALQATSTAQDDADKHRQHRNDHPYENARGCRNAAIRTPTSSAPSCAMPKDVGESATSPPCLASCIAQQHDSDSHSSLLASSPPHTRTHSATAGYDDVFGSDLAAAPLLLLQGIVRQRRKSIASHPFFHIHLSACSDLYDLSVCQLDWPAGAMTVPSHAGWADAVHQVEVEVDVVRLLSAWRRSDAARRLLRRLGEPPAHSCSSRASRGNVVGGSDNKAESDGPQESERVGEDELDCGDGRRRGAVPPPLWTPDDPVMLTMVEKCVDEERLAKQHPLLRNVAQDLLSVVQFLATR